MWGLRPALGKYGVTLGILENVETFGNLTGGSQQGFEANGLTTVTLQMDTQKAFGLSGGTFNVSGLQIWGGNLTTRQSSGLADPHRHRGARRRSTLGALVSAEIRRQVRHQDRRAEPRRGIHHQPERQLPLHQRRVRFSGASSCQFTRRRTRLSAGGPRRSRTGAADRHHHRARRRLQREPDPAGFAERADQQPTWRELPARRRHFGDRRTPICIWFGRIRKPNADGPLPGVYKIGAWYDSYKFNDLQTDTIGLPLASPLSNGTPADASRRFFALWRRRPDDLAIHGQRQSHPEYLRPSDVHAIPGSQPR